MRPFLEFVQKAPEDIQWTIGKQEFDEMSLDMMVFPMVSSGALVVS